MYKKLGTEYVCPVAEIKEEIMEETHCTHIQLIRGVLKCTMVCDITFGGME